MPLPDVPAEATPWSSSRSGLGSMRLSSPTCRRRPVSEIFDPASWAPVDGFELTDITYHRAVGEGPARGHRAHRVRPAGGAQRVPPAHRRRALPGPRPRPDDARTSAACCSPATGRRRGTAAGRSAPAATSASAAGRATSTPRARPPTPSTPARVGGARRPAAHPRGAAADPDHAQGRRRRRARLGGRRRALAARRLRPDHRVPRARAVQADRRRRRLLRRGLRLGVPREDGRAEVRPRDLLPRPRLRRRDDAPHGRRQHRRRPRVAGAGGARGRRGDQRQEPDVTADAEVRVQPASTTG